ncbi:MAG: tRNA-dihydrouridine synthase family protein [Planctomycetaceae bacterium]|jgi:nifR3 family TIM-barrel protein|nr:tRNA-dihydrouridine synthase family protein [Planctomycetaceae bacterium]
MKIESLKIGNLTLGFPVIQAALSGYSDVSMRQIARKHGANFTLCEVMLDQFVLNVGKGKKSRLYLNAQEEEHPVGAQLMGTEPEMFVSAAKKMVETGFDLIDLNFACPVKKVLGRGRGGFFMSKPAEAVEIIDRVRSALPDSVPLTMKLRKGFDDSAESEDAFFEILEKGFRKGIAAVTLHGRTVRQKYLGESDWNFVSRVKKRIGNRILLGSGDLFSAETVRQRMTETGVDGVALARGAIGNPWLFGQIRALLEGKPLPPPPALHEQRETIQLHYDLSEAFYGPVRAAAEMRKFGVYYSRLHPDHELVRADFVASKTRSQWQLVLEKWYHV